MRYSKAKRTRAPIYSRALYRHNTFKRPLDNDHWTTTFGQRYLDNTFDTVHGTAATVDSNRLCGCQCFRLCLILSNREVMEEALVKNSSCFAGREMFHIEKISNEREKGTHRSCSF